MKRRHKVHTAVSRKTKGKKGWFARYRIHILSLLGLFALFFGVLSYYQQSNSVLGLATAGRFDIGGGLSGASKSVSTSCKSVKTYCDKKYGGITKYSQCTQTVKYSNKPKPTINPLRDYTTATYIKGCKSSYEIKLSPTPTPGITLSAINLYCDIDKSKTPDVTSNNLVMDLTITTNYKSTGDDFSCRNCFFQSGEEKMQQYIDNHRPSFYDWEGDLQLAGDYAQVRASGPNSYDNPYQDFINDTKKVGEDNLITEFIQNENKVIDEGPNKYLIQGFIYKNVWDGHKNTDFDTLGEEYLSLDGIGGDPVQEQHTPPDSNFDGIRAHAITIIDTTKRFNSKNPSGSLVIKNRCVVGKMQ